MRILFSFICLLLMSNGQAQTTPIPYSNYFDYWPTDTLGWTHYADLGSDDWEVGVPADGSYFTNAYSLPYAWGTNLTYGFTADSDRSLETPYFDLTDVSQHYAFSIYHKVRANSSGNQFKIEYRVGANGAWQMLDDPGMDKKNWQAASGFGNYYSEYRNSAIDLFFIQGQDSVKFRFRLNSQYNNGNGWLIDNLTIQPEYFNVTAVQGDTIRGINTFFTDFTVKTDFHFYNQWNDNYGFTDRFYFSYDNVLDAGDLLLGEEYHNAYTTINNFNHIYPLPPGLNAGNYYIFYEFDVLDTLVENDETDNTNFAVLIIDSIYTPDYVEDFDTTAYIWNTAYGVSGSAWKRGDPNNWHVEDPRSGTNAWVSGEEEYNSNFMESPYMDLSGSVNTSICWWYKTSKANGAPFFYLQKPTYGNAVINFPVYPSVSNATYSVLIPGTRYYGWDCHCESLSDYDGEQSTRFRFFAYGNTDPNSLSQVLIDDVYIGEQKPDAGLGGERDNRYTSSSLATDTLTYMLFNSGLGQLPITTTEFYWSNDSILDGSDILLGSQLEPVINDTSFVMRTFEFTKPTVVEGQYFIIYSLDAGNVVNEMREYDNIGYLRIDQIFQPTLPYYNDFETDVDGWRHSASLGDDQWEWDIPTGPILDTAFSGQKAFCTNADDTTSWHSRMHLYSPVFDLTQLQHPVIEFDLLNFFNGYGYNYWPYNMGNMMYSVDGGNSWELLYVPTNSYKRWYSQLQFQSISGNEISSNVNNGQGELLYMLNAPMFPTQVSYQGRDYDDNTHYVMDLEFIENEQQVQFMMVYANHDAPVEGMLLDNFEVREAAIDLLVNSTKKLMVSSADVQLKTFFHVKNDENYLSDTTSINIYLSADSLLDASDVFMHTEAIPGIKPYKKHLINLVLDTPPNYGTYNYLLYELDPGNLTTEVNEVNNISYLDLTMDSAANYDYPILFDFNGVEIDGWTWWHDSIGYNHGHRFRHQTVEFDYLNFPEDGVWFLDPIDLLGYSNSYSSYPTHHLEPPAFDFSELSVIEMTFDYRSVGTNSSGNNSQGGNLSYSIDGGLTWIILDVSQDPYAQNWYHHSAIESLGDQPGWGYEPEWTPAKYNLSFLGGQPDVRFRFNWRAEYRPSAQHMHGFRLDNFQIDGEYNDLIASDVHPMIPLNSQTQPSFPMTYEIENSGLGEILFSETSFYWSADTIIDAGDSLFYIVPENVFGPNTINTNVQTIYYPTPITLAEYYVLYYTDYDSTVHEPDEVNNLGWWKVEFSDSNYVDLESIPLLFPVYTDVFSDWFYFEFEFQNNGTLASDSALVSVHWSADTLLDVSDVLLYDIDEPGLVPSDYITHQGNVYFPYPIVDTLYYLLISTDINNENVESDETNNFFWVEVIIDTTGLGINEISDLAEFTFIAGEENLRLKFNGENGGEVSLSLRNSSGQVILEEESFISKENEVVIQRPNMAAGIYYLAVQKENSFHVFKFYHNESN